MTTNGAAGGRAKLALASQWAGTSGGDHAALEDVPEEILFKANEPCLAFVVDELLRPQSRNALVIEQCARLAEQVGLAAQLSRGLDAGKLRKT